jgi:hypothetical protein
MGEIILTELKYPDKFSSLMDQLLNKKFDSTPIKPPHDKGRDSYARTENNKFIIYQYKFYKTNKDFNKRDIKESLETAMKNYGENISEWILCLPREITSGEETFLEDLSKEKKVKISFIGEAIIKNMISETNFPIENYLDSQIHRRTFEGMEDIRKRISDDPRKEIKFETLGKVANHLINLQETSIKTEVVDLSDIRKKIDKNKLSESFESIFKIQMSKFPQVDNFLASGSIRGSEIDKMLTSLKMVYLRYRTSSNSGDEIFHKMVHEIIPNKCKEEEYIAYICIVCYFFHSCEVFER